MYGIDEKTDYNPRNMGKVSGRSWPVYKRLLTYVFKYKIRFSISVIFAAFVALSFGGAIMGTYTIVKYTFEPNIDREIVRLKEHIQEDCEIVRSVIGWAPAHLDQSVANLIYYARESNDHKRQAMMFVSGLVMLMTVVGGVARFLQEYLAASIATRVTVELGQEMYDNIIRLPLRFFEQRTSGEIIARLTNDVFMAGRGLTVVFMKLLREPFKAIMFLAIALWINWQLTLIGVGVLPPVAWVMIKIGQSVRKRARRSLEKVASLQTVAKETVTGITIVKGFSMEEYAKTLVRREYSKLLRQGLKMVWADAAVGPITECVMMIGFVIFIYVSTEKVLAPVDPMHVSSLLALYLALAGMLDPIRKITSVNNAIQSSVASAERAFEFIDYKPEIIEAPGALPLPPIQDCIRFEDVHFSYDGKSEVLRGVTFEVAKGEMVAIVGHSGAGKSTIVKLLPRFYDVNKGAITIDGIDIRKVNFESLRGQIGIVTQDIILFNESVRANICAGRTDYPEERVYQAAKAAHAAEFVDRLPRKYDTGIGEAGGQLSGGQRQRLAIARALMKDPTVLILDEATSSLDSESERAIQKAIEEFVVGRTSIVIAHRLSTVRRANRIIVLEEGHIVEEGSHDELLSREGSAYRRLYEVQFASGEIDDAPARPKPVLASDVASNGGDVAY